MELISNEGSEYMTTLERLGFEDWKVTKWLGGNKDIWDIFLFLSLNKFQ